MNHAGENSPFVPCGACGNAIDAGVTARPISAGICDSCFAALSSGEQAKCREILQAIDAPILLMQSDPREVFTANGRALALFGKTLAEAEGHRGGEVFACVHSFTPDGCGKDAHCEDCKIKAAIVSAFSGEASSAVSTLTIRRDRDVPYTLAVSAGQAGNRALVRIDRLTLNMEDRMSSADIKEAVRERYSAAARRVSEGGSCCGGKSACVDTNPITSNLYDVTEKGALPEAAVLASLGCGNPTALAQLQAGETVLDLGSGGGIDVLLSARRVGPTGKAYGLDMTDEMLALARQNQKAAGVENVEFIKGEIEAIPLPDNSVDVIISNCVINLSADKDKVIREAFRVLKPGGRFAVSDIVTRGEMPEQIRRQVLLWSGCIAGALQDTEYASKLAAAGFEEIGIEPTRIYTGGDAREFASGKGIDVDEIAPYIDGKFMSAFVRAKKPSSGTGCCGPSCCNA